MREPVQQEPTGASELTGAAIPRQEAQVQFAGGVAEIADDVALIASYSSNLRGGTDTTIGHPGFNEDKPNCINGHALIEGRDVAGATTAALKQAKQQGFKGIEILTSDWHIAQIDIDMVDLLSSAPELQSLSNPEFEEHPLVKGLVGEHAAEAFLEQMAGVRQFLAANPDCKMNITFRSEHEEKCENLRALLGK